MALTHNSTVTNSSANSLMTTETCRTGVSPAIASYGSGVSVPSGKVIRSISGYQKASTDGAYEILVGASGASGKFFVYGTGAFTFYLNVLTTATTAVTATQYAGTTEDGTSRISVNYTD